MCAAVALGPPNPRRNGLLYNYGGRAHDVKNVNIIVIHAAFGDATLLEVTDETDTVRHYLVDGGPTTMPGQTVPVKAFSNVVEVFLKDAFKTGQTNIIKADGMMVTHPDGDHIQGVISIFEKFPPNQDPVPGKAKFEFTGPLLLTKAFLPYVNYMKVFTDKHFEEKDYFVPGLPIDAFERQFDFFYPVDEYPGIIYNYKAPGGGAGGPAKPRILARSSGRYTPDASPTNGSSILLVINDPNDPVNNVPWVSLNGDGLGHHALQSLNKKHPKVFKVPHHGSVHNSIPLGEFEPDQVLLTSKLIVTEILLNKAIKKRLDIKDVILDKLKAKYQKLLSDPLGTRGFAGLAPALSFDDLMIAIASDFNNALKNYKPPVDTGNLLTVLQARTNTIKGNIANITSVDKISTDVYTKGVAPLPADFNNNKYLAVKRKIIAKAETDKVKRKKEGYEQVFKTLEKDFTFAEDLAFFMIRAFYNEVTANTYFISAGHAHGHPTWEIVSGIIAAAHDAHAKNPAYRCRLLLTSGNNIKGTKLLELYSVDAAGMPHPDNILTNDWTQYMSVQYFAGSSAAVNLDPNEANPNDVLPGTIQWDKATTTAQLNELKRKYADTDGAVELRKRRAVGTERYEIKPYGQAKQWLKLIPPAAAGGDVTFEISNTIVAMKLQTIGNAEKEIHGRTGVYIKMELDQAKPVAAKIEAFAKNLLNPTDVDMNNIFTLKGPLNTRKYLHIDAAGKVSDVDDSKDATVFTFIKTTAPLIAPRIAASSGDSYNTIETARSGSSDGNIIVVVPPDGRIPTFGQYLQKLGIAAGVSTFNMYDAVILLLQSDLNGYFVVNSLAQLVIGKVLQWSINSDESQVDFISFPARPIVNKANIVAQIPANDVSINFGFNQILTLSKVEFIYPELSPSQIYLSGTATIGEVTVNIKCPMPEPEELPEILISLTNNINLHTVINTLQIANINMSTFNVPLMNALRDIEITKAAVTFQQGVQGSQQVYISKLSLGVSFTNLSSYLPSSFSSLKSINTHVVVYQPKIPPIKIALDIDFEFEIEVSSGKTVPLTAGFATRPVNTDAGEQSSYDITVSVKAGSAVIGTGEGGISIADFLGAFGLGAAVTATESIPFLHSLLQKVQLKRLLLGMNSSSRNITSFVLELCIFEWNLIPDKVAIDQADLYMYYENSKWKAGFKSTATFGGLYPVDITFELSNSDLPVKFTFANYNDELTIAKFFEIFGLGSMGDLPVVGQFLSIAVTEASLDISKTMSEIRVSRGKISLHAESINIGSILTLSKIDATIGAVYDPDQSKYVFSFSVSGFVNDKLYISVTYDPDASMLSGQISVSTFKQATITDVILSLIKSTSAVDKNAAFTEVSQQSPSAGVKFNLKYTSGSFRLNDLIIDIKKVLSLGSISLERLKFEYHYIEADARAGTPTKQQYTLMGVLTDSQKANIGAVLEFDLTKDSTGKNVVTASIKPTTENALTFRKFLTLIGITTLPSVPEIEGQSLPGFFDIALTEGSITLSVPFFGIEAFSIHVETPNEVTIFESPLIKLKKLLLKVDYNKDATPKTTASLIGVFTIGGIELTLQGSKEANGDTVFRLLATSEQDSDSTANLQQSIGTLTPTGITSPVIPSDIGIPKPLNVLVAELIVKNSPSNNENSVLFTGNAQLDWPIDLGFQQFTVKQVGGKISYKKLTSSQSPPPPQFEVFVTGQFQFSESIFMSSELQFGGQNVDTVLSVSVTDANQVQIPSVADDLLGFHDPQNSNSEEFDSLLPDHTRDFQPTKVFININFTKKMFGLFGEIRSLGSGFLIAGNFSTTDTPKYGYVFGISLPQGFHFSDLLPPLSAIDDILKIRKANCMILSIDNVKVSDVVTKMKSVQQTAVSDESIDFPFANITLDNFTNDQDLVPGLSIYCELDFTVFDQGSLFNSIIQISNDSSIPSVILSALISKDPRKSVFKAFISNLTLLGAFHFTDVNLVYRPSTESQNTFELSGKVAITLGDSSFEFTGQFTCSSTQSVFSVSTGNEQTIATPLGMAGITLNDVKLSLTYNYPKDQPHTSSQSLSGTVNFYSNSSDISSPSSTPSATLTGSIIFDNYSPTVVKLVLETDKPLTIADLVATVFTGNYNTTQFLNIGFVGGHVYYARLGESKTSVEIDGVTYKKGYHIAADIEIFDKEFTIQADILPATREVSVRGFAKGAIDLGFAKFTGVSDSDASQPDVSKSPEVVFSTSPSSTSISLQIGFVLFNFSVGVGEIGFKLENEIKKFYGNLTSSSDIGFLKKPSIGFEWSKQNGFKVTNWPGSGDFAQAFDFFNHLKNYSGGSCGSLVDMAFKEGVKSEFSINVGLSKTTDPDNFLAQIDITGSYNVSLAGQVKIASVPLPKISVGIPKEDEFTLQKLPQFILDLFTKNADNIVKQILDDPERLGKIVGLAVFKTLTKKVVSSLACRNVNEDSFEEPDPDTNDEPGDEDFKEAEDSEDSFNENFDKFEDGLNEGLGDLGETAAAAAGAEEGGEGAAGLFAGIIGAFASILAFFGIGNMREKKNRAEQKKKAIEDKINKIRADMKRILDIKGPPQATFTPPNQLSSSWNRIGGSGASYHVVITGTPVDKDHLGQKTAIPIILHEETTSRLSITMTDERLYNMVGLKVTVNGTISSKGRTYNGKAYSTDVLNVHPTLHPPSNVQITYHHSSRQISVTASPVDYAESYYFELLDNSNTSLSHVSYNPQSGSTQIQCNLAHSSILDSSVGPFKVRGKSIAKSGTNIASSVYVNSNTLSIQPPPTNVNLTIPHFTEQNQTMGVTWTLPTNTNGINGFTCQIVDDKSKGVLLTKDINKASGSSSLPTTGSFQMSDLITKVAALNYTYSDIVTLKIQVSSISTSQQSIDSVFTAKSISSLKSPENVTAQFSSENNNLQISWKFSQQTTNYGLEIRDASSNIVWSKKVTVRLNPDTDSVVSNVSLSEISAVNNTNIQYSIQVISVASGNESFDSFIPNRAPGSLQVLAAPVLTTYQYKCQHDLVSMSFQQVANAPKYLIKLRKNNQQEIVFSESVSFSSPVTISVDKFIDKFLSTDNVKCSIQSLGEGSTVSSVESTYTNTLSPLAQPTNLTYTYNTDTETIVIGATAAQGVQNYLFAFINATGDGKGDVTDSKAVSDASIAQSFSTNQFINSAAGATRWKFYIQSTLSGDSTTQLPSPHLFLNQEISVLSIPSIQAMEYSADNNGLQITLAASIDNADNYKAHVSLIAKDQSVIQEFTKELPTSQGTKLTVNLKQEVSNWDSIRSSDNFATIKSTMTAGGSGYYLTSKPSQAMTIQRNTAPTNLQYSYSPANDILTVTFQTTGIPANSKIKVTLSSVQGNQEVSKEAEASTRQATFTGPQIRDKNQNEWIISAQTLGNLPSNKIIQTNHIHVLNTPHITAAAYDASSTVMSFDWDRVPNVASYKITIGYETSDGTKHTHVTSVTSANYEGVGMTTRMKNAVSNWGEVSDSSVFSIVIVALAQANTSYINSTISEAYNISPNLAFFTSSSETSLFLDWSNVYENRDIKITGGNVPFQKSVQDAQYTSVPKTQFLYPKSDPDPDSKGVTVVVDDDSIEDHYYSSKVVSVQIQNIFDTGILGYDSGTSFDDGLVALNSTVVGVKRLEINYGDSVNRIRATYRLSSEGQYIASFHGSLSSNNATIELDDNEFIIGVTANSAQSTGLSKLIIITKKANGTCIKYGPYGAATPSVSDNLPIKFSGNVVSFKGKTSSQGLINSLGFHYAFTSPTLSRSPHFGGPGGGSFDDDVITHISPVSHVQSVRLQYDSISLVSIQPTYKLTDNTTWQSTKRGGTYIGPSVIIHQVNLQFEEGEILIGIFGKSLYDGRVPNTTIGQLSLTTQKSDGSIKVYGPYGRSSAEGGTSFIAKGTVHGFFGRSAWLVDGIGVYYSLERTEMFGGTGGQRFEDKHSPTPIVGIKKLSIRYSGIKITSIQGSYLVSDGSTWEGPVHGTTSTTGTLNTIDFEDGEDIVSMIVGIQRSDSSSAYTVGYIELVTQRKDGTCKEYDRIGTMSSSDSNRFETEFKGRIVSLFGQSSSQSVDAIGALYIPIHPPLTTPITLPDFKNPGFGGNGGGAFDDKTLIPSNSPVARVKSLTVQYDSIALVSLLPAYELEDGSTYTAPQRGRTGYMYSQTIHTQNLNFEEGEIMIGISGRTEFDGRIPNTDVSQFSVITQKSDGSITIYGPYGKTSSSSGNPFIARGRVTAFFGRSGWLIDQVSVHCSLQRSVLVGSNQGKRFADEHSPTIIVGIKSLKIIHSHKIHSIQAVYNLSNGTTWTGPARGSDSVGTVETLQFEEGEDIVSIKVTMAGYVVGGLEVTTQKSDGSSKTYPRVGVPSEGSRDVELKGRVISLIGRSDFNLNAIGIKFIPLP